MKYLKIDLKTIRLQSRQFQAENPRLFLVYLLPSMLVILSGFLNPLERINESVLEQPFLSLLSHVFQAYLFPLLVSFIGAILLTSSVYTTLKLIKNPDTELSVKNSLTLFNEEHFSQTFLTLLLKRFYLFLWSIPSLLGIYFLFYSSFLVISIKVLTVFVARSSDTQVPACQSRAVIFFPTAPVAGCISFIGATTNTVWNAVV